MRIPGAEKAVVPAEKVRDYLLSLEHPVGPYKAAFFSGLGYSRANWQELQAALRILALAEDASPGGQSEYGAKFEVHEALQGPSGRKAEIVAVWIVLNGEDFPKFVTAFPGEP